MLTPEFLIALAVVLLGGAGLIVLHRRGGGKAERRRAKAIAEATGPSHAPLKPEEQEHVAEIHAIVEEYRTGELPRVRDERRPSIAAIARRYARKPKHAKHRVPRSKRFDPLTSPLAVPLENPVMVPAWRPDAYERLEFTQDVWKADDLYRDAEAKAASR